MSKIGKFLKKVGAVLVVAAVLGVVGSASTFAANDLCKNVGTSSSLGTDCGVLNNNGQKVYAKNISWCAQASSYIANEDACSKSGNLTSIVKVIINVIIYVVGLLAVVMIIYGGVKYTISAGDPGKVKSAKDTIMYGIIGLVIAVLAFAIVNFVLSSILSGTSV